MHLPSGGLARGGIPPVQMTYEEAIDWLYSTQQFGIKLGLEQPRLLLSETRSFPKSGVKVIHVAGTNGKGSTCAMIDALARACGMRCGLFTSPHLVSFRERIQVNGVPISEKKTAQHLSALRKIVSPWEHHPTFFELTLALGMKHFREQNCELIVLETGMGGRLDATTAVPADVAVITPVAMDHAQWLGETLSEVAAEKAGIIVPGKPVISSAQHTEARHVIERHAHELAAPVEFITEPLTGYDINLAGDHQLANAALALAAADRAGLPLSTDIVRSALHTVRWPGRFEKLKGADPYPDIILDAAHNPHAAEALATTWQEQYPGLKATIIFGAVEGKNAEQVLAILSPITRHIHLTPIESPRSLTGEQLAAAMTADVPHTVHPDLAGAMNAVAKDPGQAPVLICGSIFLIGQARALLTNTPTRSSSQ